MKFLQIAALEPTLYRESMTMKFLEDLTQPVFNDSIKTGNESMPFQKNRYVCMPGGKKY